MYYPRIPTGCGKEQATIKSKDQPKVHDVGRELQEVEGQGRKGLRDKGNGWKEAAALPFVC